MRLPDHLDYDEVQIDAHEWAPNVFCKIEGCLWAYEASWSDLADDSLRYSTVDWNAEHPAHAAWNVANQCPVHGACPKPKACHGAFECLDLESSYERKSVSWSAASESKPTDPRVSAVNFATGLPIIVLGQHHSFGPASGGHIICSACGGDFTEETMWQADVRPCADGKPTGYTEEQALERAQLAARQFLGELIHPPVR